MPVQGVPALNKAAALLGDGSALNNPGKIPSRFFRGRVVGRAAGKTFGAVKVWFGAWGLIATAEFFAFFRDVMRSQFAKPVWFGTMADYALPVNNGYITESGKSIPPAPFFTKALLDANREMRQRGRKGSAGTGATAVRSGLYEGQKFMGDFAAFARGDLERVARRSAGQEVAGTFWGTFGVSKKGLTEPPNILAIHARSVVRNARKNLKQMGKVDKGILRASMAWGGSQREFMAKSRAQAMKRAIQAGIPGQIKHRLASMSSVPEVEGHSGNIQV